MRQAVRQAVRVRRRGSGRGSARRLDAGRDGRHALACLGSSATCRRHAARVVVPPSDERDIQIW